MNLRKYQLMSLALASVAVCACQDSAPVSDQSPSADRPADQANGSSMSDGEYGLVWATNVGGEAFAGADGTMYSAEESVSGGVVGTIDAVKGAQDEGLYQSYREGDVRVAHPLPNGTYDVTLHFAEPAEIGGRERLFDAFAEGERVMEDLDVMVFRDGKIKSALTVTAPGVVVADGELNIHFEASQLEPVLSAVVVRTAVPRGDEWSLAWSDEFNADGAPDADNWNIEEWPARKVNDEDQAYTSRENNVRIKDGMLEIEAHLEDYDEAKYTSGRIQTSGKADFLYGRFEIRAKLPRGQGTWPALWMLPSDPFTYATKCGEGTDWQGNPDCDAWPNSGEIDIMEHVGYQMNHVHGTVHTKAYYWLTWEQRKGRILLDAVDEDFHVYALDWSPERIDAYVDDVLYFTYVNEGKDWEEWPFDKPFHLIFNIAIGGAWGRAGGPIDDSVFPQTMYVDWVRVYEKD